MADDKDVRELADAKKLPLPDRIAHTNWKARVAAYDDISVACREIYDDADPKLSEFGAFAMGACQQPGQQTRLQLPLRMPPALQRLCSPRRCRSLTRRLWTRLLTPCLRFCQRRQSSTRAGDHRPAERRMPGLGLSARKGGDVGSTWPDRAGERFGARKCNMVSLSKHCAGFLVQDM